MEQGSPYPPVSVVITVYERMAYLADALDSVLGQDYAGVTEVIVVDDGSSTDVALRFRDRYPSVRWLRQPNLGVSAARQAGTQVASHDLIAYLDDDDLWHPEKLRRQVDFLARHPELGLSYTDFGGSGELDRLHGGLFAAKKLLASTPATRDSGSDPGFVFPRDALIDFTMRVLPLSPCTLMIRAGTLRSLGGWDARVGNFADCHDFLLRANHEHEVGYVALPLTGVRRGHEVHLTVDADMTRYWECLGLLRALDRYDPRLAERVRPGLEGLFERTAGRLRRAGRHARAAKLYWTLTRAYGWRPKRFAQLALSAGLALARGQGRTPRTRTRSRAAG